MWFEYFIWMSTCDTRDSELKTVICVCSEYMLLREHFKASHILCEEGECCHTEFTNVFRTDIDYRAHWAQKHSAGVGRQQARQMRQIDISVDFGDTGGDSRGYRGGHQRGLLTLSRHLTESASADVAVFAVSGMCFNSPIFQAGHLSVKPGKVREFHIGQGNVREVVVC